MKLRQGLRGFAAAVERRRGTAPASAIGLHSQSDEHERRARLGALAFGPQPVVDVGAVGPGAFAVDLERSSSDILTRNALWCGDCRGADRLVERARSVQRHTRNNYR